MHLKTVRLHNKHKLLLRISSLITFDKNVIFWAKNLTCLNKDAKKWR